MRVSSAGFPSTLSVAPPVRRQPVGEPCSWRPLAPPLLHPSQDPLRWTAHVNLQTDAFQKRHSGTGLRAL